jgi:hypothetical protein
MGAAASSTVGVLLPMAALLFTVVLLSKEYWEDKAFPHYHIEGAVWKPISRVYPTWPLYCEDEDQFKYSVIQGRLGNCSLVACIAAVGEFPSVVKALVAEHENGRYTVRLGGDESDAVEVDEYIPFFSASSEFSALVWACSTCMRVWMFCCLCLIFFSCNRQAVLCQQL